MKTKSSFSIKNNKTEENMPTFFIYAKKEIVNFKNKRIKIESLKEYLINLKKKNHRRLSDNSTE